MCSRWPTPEVLGFSREIMLTSTVWRFEDLGFFLFFFYINLLLSPAQPAGLPEILKKSLHSCSVRGGEEVFIIGKNFLKGTKVIFQENVSGTMPHLLFPSRKAVVAS